MNKLNLQPLKGFRDFLPAESKKRQYVINTVRQVFELFGFEHRLDARDELGSVKWLIDKIIGASLDRLDLIGGLGITGKHNHGNKPFFRISLHLAADLVAGSTRHIIIKDHQVRAALVDHLTRRRALA